MGDQALRENIRLVSALFELGKAGWQEIRLVGEAAAGDGSTAVQVLNLMDASKASTYEELGGLLGDALLVWGDVRPSLAEASFLAIDRIAHQLDETRVSPAEGARQLREIARLVPEVAEMLRPMVFLIGEWEDDQSNRTRYEADIVAEAARMLQGR